MISDLQKRLQVWAETAELRGRNAEDQRRILQLIIEHGQHRPGRGWEVGADQARRLYLGVGMNMRRYSRALKSLRSAGLIQLPHKGRQGITIREGVWMANQ